MKILPVNIDFLNWARHPISTQCGQPVVDFVVPQYCPLVAQERGMKATSCPSYSGESGPIKISWEE